MSAAVKSQRSVLILLALFFAMGGALRLGDGIGAALAAEEAAKHDAPTSAPEPVEPQTCPAPPAELAKALKARDEELRAKSAAIEDRFAALTLAEAAIEKRMAEMTAAEASLKETLAMADGAAEKDIARLTAVYEAMKPADAAKLFETMSPEFAAGFLGRMQPPVAAAVLSGMKPETAYAISTLIAGRNALVPKE